MRRGVLRKSVPIAALVLGLGLSAGCAVDEGTALAADFEEDWAGTPDVAGISTTKNNTLPFSGTSTGTLTLVEGTPAGRVTALAGEMRDYAAGHAKITGRIAADAVTFTVATDESDAAEVLSLWQSLAGDDRVKDADIDEAASKKAADRRRVEVTTADAGGALAVFKDVAAAGGRHRPLSGTTVLRVTGPGLFVETDFHDAFPAEAIAAYEAVRARYPVLRASLRRDAVSGSAVTVVVADGADAEQAAEVARRAAPDLGEAVEVTGPGGS
ncbi:hypothetical protein [Streptomyces genisteinicus]|uniref:Lipoprotein n=1 Tax=Streptomyces genisteinicus TaxID=2768068 RepID=A0A7H0I2X9_9ACTN|nr:hypothetical protein [Streptomyces genisteinicus]QNP67145.1 hypothetical protein IAG43_32465 [Streptomyces genisteinicus]